VLRLVHRAAVARRGSAAFGYIDGEKYAHQSRALSVGGALPALATEIDGEHFAYTGTLAPWLELEAAGAGADGQGKLVLTSEERFHAEVYPQLLRWVDSLLLGRLSPTIRTQEPPIDNFRPVMRLVGSSVESLAMRAKMDVLLYVHAPWCAACTERTRQVEQFAELWEGERRLRVASIDVSRNDLPRSLRVESLPALLFFKAGRAEKEAAVDMSHAMTSAEMLDAVMAHASVALTRPVDTAELEGLLQLLPRLSEETLRLVAENERLRASLATIRTQLAVDDRRPS